MIPLVYKIYLFENKISYNYQYKNDLYNLFKDYTSLEDIKKITYNLSDLTRFYTKLHKDQNLDYYVYKVKKSKFELALRPGFSLINIDIEKDRDGIIPSYNDIQFMLRFGVEIEYFLNKKRTFAVILEPNFSDLSSVKNVKGTDFEVDTHLTFIDFPIGLRYYFMSGYKFKSFINLQYNSSYFRIVNRGFVFTPTLISDKVGITAYPQSNVLLGIGGVYKNKLGMELRYASQRNLLDNEWNQLINASSNFNLTLILFYKLL